MRRSTSVLGALAVVAALSCTKNEPAPTPPAEPSPAAGAEGGDDSAEDLPPKLAQRLEQSRKQAEEIAARWTPELIEVVTTLQTTDYESTDAALAAILASPHRAPGNAERDKYRHPKETLAFFGLERDMKVFEYAQGAGWYTEILAPLLAKEGTLYLAGYDGQSEDPQVRFGARMMELFIETPGNLYESVELVTQKDFTSPPVLGEPGSLDMVLVIRMFHNVQRAGMWDSLMPAIHASLRTGGVLGVVQHRAAEDAAPEESAPKGYLSEPWLVEKIESYGFKLEARSEINANPKDTKDYEKGVWTLPPVLQLGDQDRDQYLELGESDRATLKFVKVAK